MSNIITSDQLAESICDAIGFNKSLCAEIQIILKPREPAIILIKALTTDETGKAISAALRDVIFKQVCDE